MGTLLRLTPDSIVVSYGEARAERHFALSSLSDLAVSRGRHSRTGRGALIGLVSGAVAGVATGLILCTHEECESSGEDFAGLATATLVWAAHSSGRGSVP
jgi:hypothetical protein